nr:unnamed protein product [Spirometra erinaceieuropaei]
MLLDRKRPNRIGNATASHLEETTGNTVEYASPMARKVAVRPDLYTIEEVSEEEKKATELSFDEIFEDSEMESEPNNFTPILKRCTEDKGTVCKETLPDTNVLLERTWSHLKRGSNQSPRELYGGQNILRLRPEDDNDAVGRKTKHGVGSEATESHWKTASHLEEVRLLWVVAGGVPETQIFAFINNYTVQKQAQPDTDMSPKRTCSDVDDNGKPVAEMAIRQPTRTDTAARRLQRRNWDVVSQLPRSAVEYAPPIARKVAVKPTLYTIEEVSEDEERAEELNWDESYEEEDEEENGLDEATLFSPPNAENNSTAQKPPLPDTNLFIPYTP